MIFVLVFSFFLSICLADIDARVLGTERDHLRRASVETEPDAQGAKHEREQAGRAVSCHGR